MANEIVRIKLEDLGYTEFFDSKWKSLGLTNFSTARVIAEHKEAYRVKNADGEYLAKITGKQIFNATERVDYPAVGDWVAITELDKGRAVIQDILPRKTILRKKYSDKQDAQVIAANIDVAFIVEALDRDYNLNRFERYFVLANAGGITPVIVLNKIDLVSEAELNDKTGQIKNRFGCVDVILTSVVAEKGLVDLMNYVARGKTYCFLGSSGVGKSSLINKLLKSDAIKIKEISDSTGRGRHTTTARGMYFLENGGIVIDNPGTREVGIVDADAGIENVFDEIPLLSKGCRYVDCTHVREPGCAVLKAIEDGKLDKDKYQNYIKLKKESEFYKMTDFERRKKDRKFGQFKKVSMERLKKIKP
jgi:ribosome biogenesis GTPase / thiamine phosphate phosphatase